MPLFVARVGWFATLIRQVMFPAASFDTVIVVTSGAFPCWSPCGSE
jgi:hypothetical protein